MPKRFSDLKLSLVERLTIETALISELVLDKSEAIIEVIRKIADDGKANQLVGQIGDDNAIQALVGQIGSDILTSISGKFRYPTRLSLNSGANFQASTLAR